MNPLAKQENVGAILNKEHKKSLEVSLTLY